MEKIEPFEIKIHQEQLDDLQNRLRNVIWPDEPENVGWNLGTNLAFMKELVEYWKNEYNWKSQENFLNNFNQYKVNVENVDIHFIYEKCNKPNSIPLLLIHGWPDSFYRYHKVIKKLSEDFDVIVPSIPGMGFSEKISLPMDQVADLFNNLMTNILGYKKFISVGGDIGSIISLSLAQRYPESLLGYHLTDVGYPDYSTDFASLSKAEQEYAQSVGNWFMRHGAFNLIQSTKPQSLSFSMSDSPVGLSAWIISSIVAMGNEVDFEKKISKDEILTNIMIYWLTNTSASSFRIYNMTMNNPPTIKIKNTKIPVAVATEVPIPEGVRLPREWAERQTYNNVVQFHDMQNAGHFAPWEDPEFFIKDLYDFATLIK